MTTMVGARETASTHSCAVSGFDIPTSPGAGAPSAVKSDFCCAKVLTLGGSVRTGRPMLEPLVRWVNALQLRSGAATGNKVSRYALAPFSQSESDTSVRRRTQKCRDRSIKARSGDRASLDLNGTFRKEKDDDSVERFRQSCPDSQQTWRCRLCMPAHRCDPVRMIVFTSVVRLHPDCATPPKTRRPKT